MPAQRPQADAFTPLGRELLSEQVTRIVVDGLLAGTLHPGDRLVEEEIARALRISRSPVREAFAELLTSGVLVKDPGRGTTIRRWSVRDVEEFYAVRALLEGEAASCVAERVKRAGLGALPGIVQTMGEAALKRDESTLIDLDLQFHREIWRLSGNGFLEKVLLGLAPQYRIFLALNVDIHADLAEVATLHADVVAEISSGSAARARSAVRAHLEASSRRMIAGMQADGTTSPTAPKRRRSQD
ncbi:GntR family transcriptional regulator [Roseomonas fluvialis]|uniref:GntR family transcriptional regulator n=1 Tax=Roseomonas fluvialis TaxID=1750527 RepID=A0ABN6P292_9PROT|nr:GntR family transcriptional regulator [Roseomonas fluvialis]